MKRWIGIIALLLAIAGTSAQTKVVERSAKKTPAWLNTAVDNHLVVSVTAASLAEAQTRALNEVTERIIQAVASNVTVSKKNEMSEVNIDGQITSKDSYTQVSRMKSANLPFLKGISLSNVEELYWERVQDKNTGQSSYNYHVLYPFSHAEQQRLIAEFEALDAEKVASYEALKQKLHTLESMDEIKEALAELATLSEYFFDEVRLGEVRGLTEQYKELYKAVTVTGTHLEPGRYQCVVLLEGRPVRVSTTPKVQSVCAGQLSARPADGGFLISYSTEDCLPEEENTLEITFLIHGKRYRHQVLLAEAGNDPGTGSFSVVPEGRLLLTADSVAAADRKLTNLHIRLTLNNRGGTPFGLKALELHIPELAAPVVFDDIDGVYRTKGIVQVRALAEGTFRVKEKKTSPLSFAKGSLTLVNPETGTVECLPLSLPYVTNWE